MFELDEIGLDISEWTEEEEEEEKEWKMINGDVDVIALDKLNN